MSNGIESDGKIAIETREECEFFRAMQARKLAEQLCPRQQQINRLAAIVRGAGQSATAVAVALYEEGCRLPEPDGEPEGPAAA